MSTSRRKEFWGLVGLTALVIVVSVVIGVLVSQEKSAPALAAAAVSNTKEKEGAPNWIEDMKRRLHDYCEKNK